MRKKKILFVIDALRCAGAEKSLVTLLSLLDYTKYEVDLQLFWYGCPFEQFLPKEVNLLPRLSSLPFWDQNYSSINIKKIIAYIKYLVTERIYADNFQNICQLYWKYLSSYIEKNTKTYDVAIAYGQELQLYYVIDKTRATYKVGWVNCMLIPKNKCREFMYRYYSSFNNIVLVSDTTYDCFAGVYPDLKDKMSVIYDIIDAGTICRMSMSEGGLPDDSVAVKILTVARFECENKGYDITMEACRILKERGLQFKWYVIGEGEYRKEMEDYIHTHHLEDTFILLGIKPNPYPYFRDCTIYVQTSRHEGFGLSIAEARLLNKPVVTTEFEAVYCQMVQGKNGLVVPLEDPVAVADAIERLMRDKALYNSIVAYQQHEKKGNTEEIKKFYELIDSCGS